MNRKCRYFACITAILVIVITLVVILTIKPSNSDVDNSAGCHTQADPIGILSAPTASTTGKTFGKTDEFVISRNLAYTPLTYEAWIKLPVDYAISNSHCGGVILGNFYNYTYDMPSFSFEIDENAHPQLYYRYSTQQTQTVTFDEVTINTNAWVHLAIVNDIENQKLLCYINGELMQEQAYSRFTAQQPTPISVYTTPMIGNDYRIGTKQYFKGEIHSVAVYADVRTADEIRLDQEAYGTDGLIAAWDVSGGNCAWIEDVSGNGHDISLPKIFSTLYAETRVNKNLSGIPVTYEAWINLPVSYATDTTTTQGGTILGNYRDTDYAPAFTFAIGENGWPQLYYQYAKNDTVTVTFHKVKVNQGVWLHLSIVNDTANKKFVCYINGEPRQEISYDPASATTVTLGSKQFKSIAYDNADRTDAEPIRVYANPIIGNDLRNNADNCFKGKIHAIALYHDCRTVSLIKADMVSIGTDDLIAGWYLRQASRNGILEDISDNGHNVATDWIAKKAPVTDYAYSFAVLGDTQSVNTYDPNNFPEIYNWIVANKDAKKIKYVLGLGDITDKNKDDEWVRAAAGFDKLFQAGIPYTVVIGNHDGITNTSTVNISKFNNAIGTANYNASLGGKYDENYDNTWRKIEIGGTKYLIIALSYGANDDILNWASGIIDKNPDYRVIITTHAYLSQDGATLASSPVGKDRYGKARNTGYDIYNELISRHTNIILVLSGHIPHPYIVHRTDNGTVQLLTDHQYVDRALYLAGQDTTGMVTMFYFSEDGTAVTIECYSTVYQMYYRSENQFTLTLSVDNP